MATEETKAKRAQIQQLVGVLHDLMRAAKVPQVVLARFLRVSQTTVSGWCSGRALPHPSCYTPLAVFTGKLVDGLKSGELPLKGVRQRGKEYHEKLYEYFTKDGDPWAPLVEKVRAVREPVAPIPVVVENPMHEPETEPEPEVVLKNPLEGLEDDEPPAET